MLAFLNRNYAYFNLYYLIPFVYVMHVLPFHVILSVKEYMYKDTWTEKTESIVSSIYPVKVFSDMKEHLSKVCFENPISSQGMLIFGALTSAYAIKKSTSK
jgi:hypothetical protein